VIPSWLESDFQDLVSLANNKRLHHAVLLLGNKGIGKRSLVQSLSQKLLCLSDTEVACGQCKSCALFSSHTHPDYLFIAPEKQSINVDQVRLLSDFFTSTASYNGTKVAVIDQAHFLNTFASNALLKTLEEPNNNRFIILTSELSSSLSPTLLSRCFKLTLKLDLTQSRRFLTSQGIDTSKTFIEPFLNQPFTIFDWYKNDRFSEIEWLYNVSQSTNISAEYKRLVDILGKNHDYINLFVQFLMLRLKTELLSKQLSAEIYQANSQMLIEFLSHLADVKGLNLSLQLEVLTKKLGFF
jgi:DNA polymerase-3 subunit delta'